MRHGRPPGGSHSVNSSRVVASSVALVAWVAFVALLAAAAALVAGLAFVAGVGENGRGGRYREGCGAEPEEHLTQHGVPPCGGRPHGVAPTRGDCGGC